MELLCLCEFDAIYLNKREHRESVNEKNKYDCLCTVCLFKDNQPVTETQSILHCNSVSKHHFGNESYALKGSKVSKMDFIVLSKFIKEANKTDITFHYVFWVLRGSRSVDYAEKTLCAVRGSTVVIHCQFNNPQS